MPPIMLAVALIVMGSGGAGWCISSRLGGPSSRTPVVQVSRALAGTSIPSNHAVFTSSPNPRQIGATVRWIGHAFQAGRQLTFITNPGNHRVDSTVITDGTGSFDYMHCGPPVPAGCVGPPGTYTVRAQTSEDDVADTQVTILPPTLSISPASGRPGDRVTTTGHGFEPNHTVTLSAAGAQLYQTSTDGAGSFQCCPGGVVPAASPGVYVVRAQTSDQFHAEFTFTVLP